MKKVIAINSSKRKKNTYNILVQIKEILQQNNIEVEIINLYDYDIDTCVGCEVCVLKDKCVLKDDIYAIFDKMKESDGIILSSPVYLQGVSGKMKIFIDRTCSWFHRPPLEGKPMLCVATTKGSGLKSTLKYLESVVTQWGGFDAGSIGRNIRNIEENVTDKELQKFITLLSSEKSEYKPNMNSLINFQVQKVLSKHMIEVDREYWHNRGWHDKIYYFDCKINPIKKVFCNVFYKMMSKAMKIED